MDALVNFFASHLEIFAVLFGALFAFSIATVIYVVVGRGRWSGRDELLWLLVLDLALTLILVSQLWRLMDKDHEQGVLVFIVSSGTGVLVYIVHIIAFAVARHKYPWLFDREVRIDRDPTTGKIVSVKDESVPGERTEYLKPK